MTALRLTIKEEKMGIGSISGNLCSFPQIIKIILPLISLWKTNHAIFGGLLPSEMAYTLWSVFLSKQVHFLPITLSLTEFFLWWDIKNLSFIMSWNQVPWVLIRFELQPCGFKSQTGFWLGLSPSHMGSSLKLDFGWVHQVPGHMGSSPNLW